MNLLDLMMGDAEDPKEKALDRLEAIVALFDSEDEAVQDEALARAITFCGKEWGSYRAGMEALASRREGAEAEDGSGDLAAWRFREEGEDPGLLIRVAREQRQQAARADDERTSIINRYGGLDNALGPTPLERIFVDAAAPLGEGDDDDPWGALAGWSVPWHEVPPPLREAVSSACPLPGTIPDARAEVLSWDERLRELQVLAEPSGGRAALPTACAARARIVEDLWRRALPVREPADLECRMAYWAEKGGDDGSGYSVLLSDLRGLLAQGVTLRGQEGTKAKCRRLRAEHPEWSLARIGKELGISRQAVHKHLKG